MAGIIKDEKFVRIAENVKPDVKKRVVLPEALVQEGIIYHIYGNSAGQIVLDPQVTAPASEAWLFDNPEALDSVRRGLDDVTHARVSKVDPEAL